MIMLIMLTIPMMMTTITMTSYLTPSLTIGALKDGAEYENGNNYEIDDQETAAEADVVKLTRAYIHACINTKCIHTCA